MSHKLSISDKIYNQDKIQIHSVIWIVLNIVIEIHWIEMNWTDLAT